MATPEDKYIDIDGLIRHYLDWGNTASSPIVLLHGICNNAHYWDSLAAGLQDTHRLIAIDQRGHGDSGRASRYGPRDYVGDLERFVEGLPLDRFTLIGHSLGGINAMLYAQRHPDRVERLAVVDIGPEIAAAGAQRILDDWAHAPDGFDSLASAFAYFRRLEPYCPDAFIRHQLQYALYRDAENRLVYKYDKALEQTPMRSPEWLWAYLEQIICPTLILRGTESDMLTAACARRMVETLPLGTLVEIAAAGHGIPGDNPQALESAIRQFLSP